jgi:hypothetical protein
VSEREITLLDGTALKAGDSVLALVNVGEQTRPGARRWAKYKIREVIPGVGVDKVVIGQGKIVTRYNLKAIKRKARRGR